MKQVIPFIGFIIFLLIASCQQSSLYNDSLTGKWKLVETLADPGDGSGQWQPPNTEVSQFINFNTDSTINSNRYPSFKKYRIIDSVKVAFIQANGNAALFRYKVSGSSLQINESCIEPCGSRFIRE